MKKIKKNLYFGLIPISILLIMLVFYLSSLENETINNTTTKTSIENNVTTSVTNSVIVQDEDNEISDTTISKDEKVLILDLGRCSGCGKCARIDSEHFEMSGQFATVISQENLDSSILESAINACHDGAISIG